MTTATTLGALADSGVLAIGDGYRTKGSEYDDAGIPILRVAEVLEGKVAPSFKDRVSLARLSQIGPKQSRPGDVIVTTKGTVGRVALIPESLPPHVYSPQLCYLRVEDSSRVDHRWLYSWARSPQFQRQTGSVKDQTDMAPYVSLGDLRRFRIQLPPLNEQRRVAEVLGALDDLIDTNDRTLDSLVALTNAQFDRRFGLRSLGQTVGELAKVVDCLHSKKPEQSAEGGRLLLQLNNIRDDGLMDLQSRYVISEKDYALWSKNLETKPHDLVVTNVGRVGAVARVPVGLTAALGRNMTAVRANDPVGDAAFITAALLSSAVRREIENKTDSGTILNALNVRSIPKLRLQDSTPEERTRFSEWALPLLEMCDSLIAHNAQLRRTRDELLPLLMSGAVRVRPEGIAA